MKRLGRLLGVLSMLALLLALLGCGGKMTGSDVKGTGVAGKFADGEIKPNTFANMTNKYKLPITREVTPITVMIWEPETMLAPRSDWVQYQELEKRTNIKVEWKSAPGAKYEEYFTANFAAGRNLPDLAIVSGGGVSYYARIAEFAAAGMVVPLEDLIVKYAPNFKAFLDRRPDIRKLLTYPDGHIYAWPQTGMGDISYFTHVVRQDWMDKLGLSTPDTLDDWITMLKAFRDNDPNGNGKKDEIQIFLYGADGIINWGPFKASYGLMLSFGGGWAVDNGKVYYAWLSPKAKDYVAFLKRLYDEAILRREEFDDPDFTSHYSEYVNSGRVGVVATYAYYLNPNGFITEMQDPQIRWTAVPDPVGPYGDRVMESQGALLDQCLVMTKDCKDPVSVMKWLDYLWATQDGYLLMVFGGEEGVTYRIEDGHPIFTLWDETTPKDVADKWANTRIADEQFPWNQAEDVHWEWTKFPEVQQLLTTQRPYLFNCAVFNNVPPTTDEAATISQYWDAVWGYMYDMVPKFVTGKEPLANWDAFVEQLKKLGAEELQKVKQAQYDRATR